MYIEKVELETPARAAGTVQTKYRGPGAIERASEVLSQWKSDTVLRSRLAHRVWDLSIIFPDGPKKKRTGYGVLVFTNLTIINMKINLFVTRSCLNCWTNFDECWYRVIWDTEVNHNL